MMHFARVPGSLARSGREPRFLNAGGKEGKESTEAVDPPRWSKASLSTSSR